MSEIPAEPSTPPPRVRRARSPSPAPRTGASSGAVAPASPPVVEHTISTPPRNKRQRRLLYKQSVADGTYPVTGHVDPFSSDDDAHGPKKGKGKSKAAGKTASATKVRKNPK